MSFDSHTLPESFEELYTHNQQENFWWTTDSLNYSEQTNEVLDEKWEIIQLATKSYDELSEPEKDIVDLWADIDEAEEERDLVSSELFEDLKNQEIDDETYEKRLDTISQKFENQRDIITEKIGVLEKQIWLNDGHADELFHINADKRAREKQKASDEYNAQILRERIANWEI